jgi:cytochrome c oxidase subunit 2
VKQDAVPGLVIPVWFDALKSGTFDLVCAELCGWGHYKMRGQIYAENETDFVKYLHNLEIRQNDDGTKSEEEVASAQEGK